MHRYIQVTVLGLSLVVAACDGSGSDIGPRIPVASPFDYQVTVQDDSGRPVTNALVTVPGTGASAGTAELGRARLATQDSGTRLITVDGTHGSAVQGDDLGTVTFMASMPDGGELPYVVHLPDVSGSTGATVSTGVLGSPVTVDGALALTAGTSIGFGAATSVQLRTGSLAQGHLPGDLPTPGTGARLWSAGWYLDPATVTLSPGGALTVTNDLGSPAGTSVMFFRLDVATGAWTQVGSAAVDGTGANLVAAAGSVTVGGLYAFAVDVASTATIDGLVLDTDGFGVSGALVRVPGARTRTFGNGTFVLPAIPAVDGAGAARSVPLEVTGGRNWRPVRTSLTVPLTPGSVTIADQVLDTTPVSLARVQVVSRGAADPFRRLFLSSTIDTTFGGGVGDAQGLLFIEGLASGTHWGSLGARIFDRNEILLTQLFAFVPAGQRIVDIQAFTSTQPWWTPRERNGSTLTSIHDELGTGPLRDVAVTRGAVAGQGFVARSNDNGVITAEYGDVGQATASLTSEASGTTVHSAFTVVDVDSARIEVPLRRARPTGSGFAPHGLASGQLVGASSGKIHRLRATRRLTLQGWYDEVFADRTTLGNVPLEKDPGVAPIGEFAIGLPRPSGQLAGVEGSPGSGVFTLEKVGIQAGLVPVDGGNLDVDVPLDLSATTEFAATRSLVNLHSSLLPTDLSFDYGVELADGAVVDVVRGVDGNMLVSGQDLRFQLPALTGVLAGARHLVALRGTSTTGSGSSAVTVDQRTFIPFSSQAGPIVRFLDVPDIVSPAPGATVSSTEFAVQFTVPISTLYTIVELRSAVPTETWVWRVVLPASIDQFSFRQLPPGSPQPLVFGRNYTLTVTAARVETGLLAGDPDAYRRITQNWVSVGTALREVNAWSSTQINISTN